MSNGPAAFRPRPRNRRSGRAWTVTLDIVTTAALLFVVATGLLVIFGVLKIINFAHGAFLTVGAYGALATTAFGLIPGFRFRSPSSPERWSACWSSGWWSGHSTIARLTRFSPPGGSASSSASSSRCGFGREIQFAQSPLRGTI